MKQELPLAAMNQLTPLLMAFQVLEEQTQDGKKEYEDDKKDEEDE